ncbi:MAG TPA: hypothetical protein VKU01_19900 [Bryobacteraceae bacterium]|nr:hypothetical protein [Bryobacteraceae bacterium]
MIDKRFVYRGSAVGVEARVTRILTQDGLQHVIPVQGASTLPQTGGLSESSVRGYDHPEKAPNGKPLVHVGSATTRAAGHPVGVHFVTEVSASVEDVDFYGQLYIGSASASLVSIHDGHNAGPLIHPDKIEIKGLNLGGYGLTVRFDLSPFTENRTMRALQAAYSNDNTLRQKCAARFNTEPSSLSMQEYGGYCVTSLATEFIWDREKHPKVEPDGYSLVWNGFGRIMFGEMLISGHEYRLTLMRLRMGSDVGGDGSVCSIDTDGSTMP